MGTSIIIEPQPVSNTFLLHEFPHFIRTLFASYYSVKFVIISKVNKQRFIFNIELFNLIYNSIHIKIKFVSFDRLLKTIFILHSDQTIIKINMTIYLSTCERRTMSTQRYPHPNSQSLCICHFT